MFYNLVELNIWRYGEAQGIIVLPSLGHIVNYTCIVQIVFQKQCY